ncbi:MAG TPA: NADH-quinone oxidoreductase subunit K [Ignavibacteria bacterium]|nr:NADH-quinone oxidoreductase subunit K [Ignavibacteria bacterium]
MKYIIIFFILVLLTSGFYMILRRSLVKLIIGVALLSHAANLIIFTSATLTRFNPPLIPQNLGEVPAPYADPIPQALILTSIVISFALTAFSVILIKKIYLTTGSEDTDAVNGSDIIYKDE